MWPRRWNPAIEGRRILPQGGHRRVDHLPARRLPRRAPSADPHEQHDRTIEPGDPPPHPRRRQLPGWQERAHAHLRQDPPYVTANQWSARRYLDMSRLDGIMQSTTEVIPPDDGPGHICAKHRAQPDFTLTFYDKRTRISRSNITTNVASVCRMSEPPR